MTIFAALTLVVLVCSRVISFKKVGNIIGRESDGKINLWYFSLIMISGSTYVAFYSPAIAIVLSICLIFIDASVVHVCRDLKAYKDGINTDSEDLWFFTLVDGKYKLKDVGRSSVKIDDKDIIRTHNAIYFHLYIFICFILAVVYASKIAMMTF